jgi:muramoyltetrapeptide carboxypeptidase
VSGWRKSPNDRGYSLASMLARIRASTRTPILTGLPFGHVATKVTLPVGAKVQLLVDRRQAFIAWG